MVTLLTADGVEEVDYTPSDAEIRASLDVVWYIVAALPPDEHMTCRDVVRLLREEDDGDE